MPTGYTEENDAIEPERVKSTFFKFEFCRREPRAIPKLRDKENGGTA